jgi:hypothetical protein
MSIAASRDGNDEVSPGGTREGSGVFPRNGRVVEATLDEQPVADSAGHGGKAPPRLLVTMPSGTPGTGDVLPFCQAAPGFTLEQMASLDVELQTWPDARPATLARYGIDGEREMAALVASWVARLGRDPALVRRWNKACETYREWLKERTTP